MVIQRWQSFLLFIAAAVMACFSFISLGQITTTDYTFNFTSLGFYQEGIPTEGTERIIIHTWYFFMLSITTIVLLLIDIFLFRNLRLQKRVCLVSILFIVADACVAGLLGYCGIDGGQIGWSTVVLCPFIALFSSIFAYYRMSADYNLLKSADRIR
ncbi:MAG: DUF4293 domain-containing protein [Muribaculaceae bacterium]|nr:DUF4293 domain-containing protein [Muribaculaceae bacterium]